MFFLPSLHFFFDRAFSSLIELIFPSRCLSCGKEGSYLCVSCFSALPLLSSQECPFCRKKSRYGEPCSSSCRKMFFFDALLVAQSYEKNRFLSRAVHAFKYRYVYELGRDLSHLLVAQYSRQVQASRSSTATFVPLHKKRFAQRGFNQSFLLCLHFSEVLGMPMCDSLIRIRNTPHQTRLLRHERLHNVKGAFILNPSASVQGGNFILIDDICTTGATLNECSRILKEGGAKNVTCLVLGRGK